MEPSALEMEEVEPGVILESTMETDENTHLFIQEEKYDSNVMNGSDGIIGVQDDGSLTVGSEDGSTLQTMDLPDGTTAILQGPGQKYVMKDKLLEGQTITLPDGSQAILQGITHGGLSDNALTAVLPKLIEGQAIQLEDGTLAYIHNSNKVPDSLQAVQLEDGTTAYIANTDSLFASGTVLDPNTISLENLSAQLSGAQANDKNSKNETEVDGDSNLVQSVIGEKGYKCNYEGCGRLYTTLHHLKVHERSHTGDRPFKCKFDGCGKAFATGYGLKSHTRVHTGEKPYKCPSPGCEKAFKTSGDLQKHVRTHTGERPFKCPFVGCNRSFTTSNIRKVHIRTHTGERPYVCNEQGCAKSFASATNYKNHIRIHTGEKPYVCTVQGCGKRFTEYSSLYKHHVVHTHTKPYLCNHCGKNYRQTSTLAMHKRTAHGEETTPEHEAALYMRVMEAAGVDLGDGKVQEGSSSQEEGEEGALVINTSEPQQVTMVTSEGIQLNVGGDNQLTTALAMSQHATQITMQQLTQAHGISFAGDGDQQILVVTDPAQFEALQQLAAQQQQKIIEFSTADLTVAKLEEDEDLSIEHESSPTE